MACWEALATATNRTKFLNLNSSAQKWLDMVPGPSLQCCGSGLCIPVLDFSIPDPYPQYYWQRILVF